jgi:hypothetical protein
VTISFSKNILHHSVNIGRVILNVLTNVLEKPTASIFRVEVGIFVESEKEFIL